MSKILITDLDQFSEVQNLNSELTLFPLDQLKDRFVEISTIQASYICGGVSGDYPNNGSCIPTPGLPKPDMDWPKIIKELSY